MTVLGNVLLGSSDISAYFIDADVRIGAQSGDLMARVGTCNITVKNVDRRFSPALSGPLSADLVPRTSVRVQAVVGGVPRTIFQGFLQRVRPLPNRYGQRRAMLECQDIIGVIQEATVDMPLLENIRSDVAVKHVVNRALVAPAATCDVKFTGTPADADALTINGTTYRYKNTIAQANDIRIDTTTAFGRYRTIENTLAAINRWDAPVTGAVNTDYYSTSVQPSFVRAKPTDSFYQRMKQAGLVRWYRMGEPSATTAYDFGENASNATYTSGPTLASTALLSGDSSTSVSFDGTNDRVDVPTLEWANKSWTWIGWIAPAATPPANQDFFSVYSGFVAGGAIYLRLYSDGTVYAEIYGNGSVSSGAGAVTFGTGTAYMIAVTYDYSTSTLKLYINGVLVDSDTVSPFTGTAPVIQIGAFTAAGGSTYKGRMQDAGWAFKVIDAAELLNMYNARTVSPGISTYATLRGAVGNGYSNSDVSAALDATAAYAGGVDYPAGLFSYDTGVQTFSFVGDAWANKNGYDALREIVQNEQGYLYVTREGVLRFENGDAKFVDNTVASAISVGVGEEVLDLDGALADADIYNDIRVSFEPRATSSTGVIAATSSPIRVPGKWGELSSNPNLGKNREALQNPNGGQQVTTLRYTDPDTGRPIGAKDPILPLVAGTDYTLNTKSDGTGADYTNGDPATGIRYFFISAAVKATEIELYFQNTALGELYVIDLQVRGTKITRYDKQTVVKDDADSIALYGRRILKVELPLGTDEVYAIALAEYLLGKNKDARYELRRVPIRNLQSVGGVDPFIPDIGDKGEFYEYQTIDPADIPKSRIYGLSYSLSVERGFSVIYDIGRVDNLAYGIYDVSEYDEAVYTV